MISWKLHLIDIENFKSIRKALVRIEDGFTVITGPNGSGKSNFVESIGFGLGATSGDLRVDNLKSISNLANPKLRTVVKLTFRHQQKVLTIGSAILDDKRVYYVGDLVVTREKFVQVRTEQLKFAKESFCWNISQHAVQDIVNASPAVLFNTLTYVANTNTLVESQNLALQQAESFHVELEAIQSKMSILEEGLLSNNQLVMHLGYYEENKSISVQLDKLHGCIHEVLNKLSEYEVIVQIKDIYTNLYPIRMKLKDCWQKKAMHDALCDNPVESKAATQNQLKEFSQKISTLNEKMDAIQSEIEEYSHKIGDYHRRKQSQQEIRNKLDKSKQSQIFLIGQAIPQVEKEITKYEELLLQCKSNSISLDALILQEETELFTLHQNKAKLQSATLELANNKASIDKQHTEYEVMMKDELMDVNDQFHKLSACLAKIRDINKEESVTIGKLVAQFNSTVDSNFVLDVAFDALMDDVISAAERSKSKNEILPDVLAVSKNAVKLNNELRSLCNSLHLATQFGWKEEAMTATGNLKHYHEEYGYNVMELLVPKNSKESNKYGAAILTLFESKWNVRVSLTESVTHALMDIASASSTRNGVIIWPVYRLTVPCITSIDTNSAVTDSMYCNIGNSNKSLVDELRQVCSLYCKKKSVQPFQQEDIADPSSLMEWNSGIVRDIASVEKILKKVVGQWIFVSNDGIADMILDIVKECNNNQLEKKYNYVVTSTTKKLFQSINGCITASGKRHVLGSMFIQDSARSNDAARNSVLAKISAWRDYCRVSGLMSACIHEYLGVSKTKCSIMNHAEIRRKTFNDINCLCDKLRLQKQSIFEISKNLNTVLTEKTRTDSELWISEQSFQVVAIACSKLQNKLKRMKTSSNVELSGDSAVCIQYSEELNALRANLVKLQDEASSTGDAIVEHEYQLNEVSEEAHDVTSIASIIKQKNAELAGLQVDRKMQENLMRDLQVQMREISELTSSRAKEQVGNNKLISKLTSQILLEYKSLSVCFFKWDEVAKSKTFDVGRFDMTKLCKLIANVIESNDVNETIENDVAELLDENSIEAAHFLPLYIELTAKLSSLSEVIHHQIKELTLFKCNCCNDVESIPAEYRLDSKWKICNSLLDVALEHSEKDSHAQTLINVQRSLQLVDDMTQDCLRNKQLIIIEIQQLAKQNTLLSLTSSKIMNSKSKSSEGFILELLENNSMRIQIETVSNRIAELKLKYGQISTSILQLKQIVLNMQGKVDEVHNLVLQQLNQSFNYFYSMLLLNEKNSSKQHVQLVKCNSNENVRAVNRELNGISIQLAPLANGAETSIQQLSGGQRALLGLSYVFAVLTMNHKAHEHLFTAAKSKSNTSHSALQSVERLNNTPIYILDECDAALDENNQKMISNVIHNLFKSNSQVLCISHHVEFQKFATNTISVHMHADGFTRISSK